MSDQLNHPHLLPSEGIPYVAPAGGTNTVARTEMLVNKMLDDQLEAAEHHELQMLLQQDESARQCYVELLRLHGDLTAFFHSLGN